jgi:hypothetical protein
MKKPTVFAGCLVLNCIAMATTAAAHVKWFTLCNLSDNPLPVQAVFTNTFFVFLALFLAVFYVACKAEQTTLGAILSGFLSRWTGSLHGRADDLLRATVAISFALLWADGGLILTPELKASSTWLSAIQLLIPAYLFWRATLPAAGAGIIVLYGYGAATYGLFHMLDYPVFLGLGVFFALSVAQNPKLLAFRSHFLRWTVALSLLWPAMEKFVYPAWVAPIAITHPELTLGFDVATVVTAAGVVEFGLAFALFWTPLVRRLAALALILLLTAATFDFGKVDGIGHMMIIIILLVVFADPTGKPESCRPLLAPLVSGVALLATIFLYTGVHTLYYGSTGASLAPIMSGTGLLGFIFLCLQGFAQVLFQMMPGLPRGSGKRRTARELATRSYTEIRGRLLAGRVLAGLRDEGGPTRAPHWAAAGAIAVGGAMRNSIGKSGRRAPASRPEHGIRRIKTTRTQIG